jgi:hypothetical protein
MVSQWVEEVYATIGDDPGFADLGVDTVHAGVIVYFHGAFPPSMTPVIARAKTNGVLIEHVQTRFGEQAFEAAAIRLSDALTAAHIQCDSIGANGRYSRIEVGGPRVSVDKRVQDRVRRLARDTIGDIPIAFVPDEGPVQY